MAVPTNIALPVLTGQGVELSLLTCTSGDWTDSPTSFTFRWRHSDVPETFNEITFGSDVTEMRITLASADVGHSISCRVAATNADGTSPFAVANDLVPPNGGHVTAYPRTVEVSEDERAATFRAQCLNRLRWRAQRWQALAGDPAAAAAAHAAFAPLLPDPVDGWDCPCPPEPARPAWADRVPGDIELPEYLKR